MEKKLYFFLFLAINISVAAQPDVPSSRMYPAPAVASMATDYQITNDLFNGKVNLSIPLYTVKANEISFPISLNYSSSGIKPDDNPTFVGSGWSLSFGGTITRISKNQPDEFIPLQTSTDIIFGTVVKSTYPGPDESYYNKYSMLNRSDWSSTSFLNSLNTNSPFFSLNIANANPLPDLEPDEFLFNINGITGRFALDYTGKWRAITDNPGVSFTVFPWVYADVQFDTHGFEIPRAITAFTLTSSDGTQYFFGDMNTSNYSDYSSQGFWEPSFDATGPWTSLEATSWHLTKITSPLGNTINFYYNQPGYQTSKTKSYYYYSTGSLSYDQHSVDKTLFTTWFPDHIQTSDGIKVTFKTSASNQLLSDQGLESDGVGFYDINSPFDPNKISKPNYFPKLDEIDVAQKNKIEKKFTFKYINNLNERLKLQEVTETNTGDLTNSSTYHFDYNSLMLPSYASGMTDHWGYYNNVNYFATVPSPTYQQLTTDYVQSRSPNATYTQAEILKSMTLPTGGTIEFSYEANDYSKDVSTFPFTVSDVNTNKATGGVRIHEILKKFNGNIVEDKTYSYTRSDKNLSSGVFAIPIPDYTSGSASDYVFHAEGFTPFNGRGSNVVYSRVIENEAGNGSTEYDYESYDNSANDAIPITELPAGQHPYLECFNNRWYERGKLRSEIIRDQSNNPVKEIDYTYSHDDASPKFKLRNIHFLPSIRYEDQTYRAAAYETDFFPDLLTSQTTTDYSVTGSFSTSTKYQYDDDNNIIETDMVNSKNELISTYAKYPFNTDYDASGTDDNSLGIKNLRTLNIRNKPIEKYTVKGTNTIPSTNRQVLDATMFTYYTDRPLMKELYNFESDQPIDFNNYTTSSISTGDFTFSPYLKRKVNFINYDIYGNLLCENNENDIFNSFQTGYSNLYVTAKVSNAQNSYRTFMTPNNAVSSFIVPQASSDKQIHITSLFPGDITIKIPPGSWLGQVCTVTLSCFISGPVSDYGVICKSNPPSQCSSSDTYVFKDMPAGSYTLDFTVTTNTAPAGNVTAECDYIGGQQVSSGTTEFFYEGFESSGNATATPYAGLKYFNGDYTVPFLMPNSRTYKVDYHYLSTDGKWYSKTKTYQNNMKLTEGTAIDEVRVYPIDAEMTSYTYEPLIGVTSECDKDNKLTSYEYDGLGRLINIHDDDKNVIKKYGYNYAGNKFKPNKFYNQIQTQTFAKNSCIDSGYSGSEVADTVWAGTYSSDSSQEEADSLASADLRANGQNYANLNGTCLPMLSLLLANYQRITGFAITLTAVYDSTKTYVIAFPEDRDSAISFQKIPQGHYNITIYKTGNTNSYVFTISGPNGDIQVNSTVGSWVNVPINANDFDKISLGIQQ